ncbi:chaperonin 10-like protein [Aspergillus carlsbadensis]|nr:chaperonin 10-like protein [Aspergillus carlsbadensis]
MTVDRNRRRPALRDDSLLVRPVAIALNPTDWKSVSYGRARDGCIVGCDYAGVVKAVGKSVTKNWKPGDRVFGCGHGANLMDPDDGVFAEYAVVRGDLQMRVPQHWSYERATTVPLGLITVGQGLFQKSLQLELPSADAVAGDRKCPVLIYGGTTATGTLAIQLAKLAGYTVITTCPAKDVEHVKGLGADHAFDYTLADVGAQIREKTANQLRHAWDTISIPSSARICADALSTSSALGLRYGNLLPVKCPRDDVRSTTTVMYTAFGRDFKFGDQDMPASQEDYAFAKMFYELGEKLITHGKLKTHAEKVGVNGLEGALDGFQLMKEGKVHGEKLVYRIADTP